MRFVSPHVADERHPEEVPIDSTCSALLRFSSGRWRYAEAEPLIVQGYEEIKAREARITAPCKPYLTQAAERVVWLYVAWGKPGQAAAWKVKLGLDDLPANVFATP